jgi:hypothetical protein
VGTELVALGASEALLEGTYPAVEVSEGGAMLGEPAWAATRGEPIIFERFSDRVKHGLERDKATIRQVFKSCPTSEKARLAETLLATDDLSELALELLPQFRATSGSMF